MIRNASVLVTGTVLAQLISILLQPLIRRLFPPESFGVFSVYLSLIGIITVVSSLRFDDAIVIPKADKESTGLIGLALFFNLIINTFLLLLFLLFGKQIIFFLNLSDKISVPVLLLVPAGAFLYNTYQSLNYWLIRKRKFVSVSVNKLVRRSSEGISQVGFALIKKHNGLIYSDLIGQLANVVITASQAFRNGLNFRLLSLNKTRYAFRKYSEFPKFNLIPAFMSACSYYMPALFVNKFFSSQSAGYFDLCKMLLSIPLAFVATSFSSVLLQKVSEKYQRRESFLSDMKPVVLLVLLISFAEIFVIAVFGEPLFKFVFGSEWVVSGTISRILVWSFALNFIVASFSTIFVTMRKIRIYSIWQFFYFLAILSLLLFRDLAFIDFLKVYVIIEVVCYLVLTVIMISIIRNFEKSLTG